MKSSWLADYNSMIVIQKHALVIETEGEDEERNQAKPDKLVSEV